jgi:uncharacterized protein (TIGR01732 family)
MFYWIFQALKFRVKEVKCMSNGFNSSFALIVVLFILLIIVGAACFCDGHNGYGYGF